MEFIFGLVVAIVAEELMIHYKNKTILEFMKDKFEK
jgi:hypothetical protein